MAIEVQLGVWLFLNIAAISGFFAASKGWGAILIISAVIWTGLALYSWGGYSSDALSVISTKNTYNATGDLIETEKQLVINSDFNTIGWLYMIGAMVSWIWLLKIIANMFKRRNKVSADGYWSK